jgi:hypothetical protein
VPGILLGNIHKTGSIERMTISLPRFFGMVTALALVCGAADRCAAQAAGNGPVIVPGVGMGQVRLGEGLEELHQSIGTPKLTDPSFGGTFSEVWRSGPVFGGRRQNGPEELQVYFAHDGDSAVVRQIRVSSPYYTTATGISIRNTFSEIQNAFPNLRRDNELTETMNNGRSEKAVEIFVDRSSGIAFEFRTGEQIDPEQTGYCQAINVFRPGTEPRALGELRQY